MICNEPFVKTYFIVKYRQGGDYDQTHRNFDKYYQMVELTNIVRLVDSNLKLVEPGIYKKYHEDHFMYRK